MQQSYDTQCKLVFTNYYKKATLLQDVWCHSNSKFHVGLQKMHVSWNRVHNNHSVI